MGKTSVLFLCTHSSARSQMAEGLLRHVGSEKYEVFSAGSTPTRVNPLAIKVMADIGIDISGQRSKSIEEFRGKDIDVVVSVCWSNPRVTCAFCSSPLVGRRPEIINETLPGAKRYIDHGFGSLRGRGERRGEARRVPSHKGRHQEMDNGHLHAEPPVA